MRAGCERSRNSGKKGRYFLKLGKPVKIAELLGVIFLARRINGRFSEGVGEIEPFFTAICVRPEKNGQLAVKFTAIRKDNKPSTCEPVRHETVTP
ncbi:hypothetical protein [Paenibacillus macerans]|uniref:hypothetical protein n=1 Tax=Paenibacillus macerans TaxID=44252 RepID=UPI0020405933|nr:hypothetical protein [Paenibacillus macerans]MCM3700783.1 hypothetical protein [Paenibacillus macerans]